MYVCVCCVCLDAFVHDCVGVCVCMFVCMDSGLYKGDVCACVFVRVCVWVCMNQKGINVNPYGCKICTFGVQLWTH